MTRTNEDKQRDLCLLLEWVIKDLNDIQDRLPEIDEEGITWMDNAEEELIVHARRSIEVGIFNLSQAVKLINKDR